MSLEASLMLCDFEESLGSFVSLLDSVNGSTNVKICLDMLS